MSLPALHRERGPGFAFAALRTDAVDLEEFRAAPDVHVGSHAHPDTHFCLVLAGAMSDREGRGRRRLVAGEGRMSPAGDEHDIRLGDERLHCLLLHARHRALEDAGLPAPEDRTYADGRRLAGLARGLSTEMRRADDASPVAIEMLALELVALFGRAAAGRCGSVPGWLTRVRERLADERRSPPTLAELAATAGVSRAHVARAFREHFGCTVGDHVRALRVEAARGLLLGSPLPLADVACRAGFADQSHMTREVRDRLGLTPGRLRAARGAGSGPAHGRTRP